METMVSRLLRWCWAPWHGGQPLQNLHGRTHRLRPARMRPHGHLHQMWEADERMPHMQAVRDKGCARL